MVPDRIERQIQIDAPVEVVWAVLTEPEHISGWFSDSVELDLRPGGEAVLVWDGQRTVHGRVERLEPPYFFSFRWVVGSGETLVEFSLSAEGERTRLRVVESGFAELPGPDDEKQGHFDGHTQGWALELGELGEYVARLTGAPADR